MNKIVYTQLFGVYICTPITRVLSAHYSTLSFVWIKAESIESNYFLEVLSPTKTTG